MFSFLFIFIFSRVWFGIAALKLGRSGGYMRHPHDYTRISCAPTAWTGDTSIGQLSDRGKSCTPSKVGILFPPNPKHQGNQA